MNTLSKQPAPGKQQAAKITRQLQQLVVSRRGVAVGAVLLAGGGYVYIQQLQAQQRAHLRYAESTLHQIDGDSLVLGYRQCTAQALRRVEGLLHFCSVSFALCAGSPMMGCRGSQTRSAAHQLHFKVWSNTCCPWPASVYWSCLLSQLQGLPCPIAWQDFR